MSPPSESAALSGAALDERRQEIILAHYRRPRHKHALPSPDASASRHNPLCGDSVTVSLRLGEGRVAEAAFEGQGCSIMLASASMMADTVHGRTVNEIAEVRAELEGLLAGKSGVANSLGELESLAAVRRVPARLECARLPWDALADALGSLGEGMHCR